MKIIRPITLTDAMLTSSTVTEDDYATWSSSTAYIAGDRCIRTTTHRIYECLVNHTNATPENNLTGTTPTWLEISATNRWRAFDAKIADQTSNATSINYVIAPGERFDSIALLNVEAVAVQIVVTDPTDGEVYNRTHQLLSTSNVTDWYTYFFEEFYYTTDVALTEIPPYSTTSISITLTGATAKVGEIILGLQRDLGLTQYSPTMSIQDYSRKDVDTFGNYIILQRAFSRKLSCDLWLPPGAVDELTRLLALYRTTPLVWIGSDDPQTGENIYSAMLLYGFYKSFSVVIENFAVAGCTLDIEGLT